MKLTAQVRFTRAGSPRISLLFHSWLLSVIWLAGCASPGTPRPPSLHLPAAVADLSASRAGDKVLLHWTTPSKTTDGLLIKGNMTAQLCRLILPAEKVAAGRPQTNGAPGCSPIRRKGVQAGPSEMVDLLPPALTTGPEILLEYRIEVRNETEHSAGLSLPAFAAAGPAPPAVADLRATAVAQGALLQWEPQDAADAIELDRRPPDRLQSSGGAPPATAVGNQRFQPAAKQPAELRLRVVGMHPGASPFQPDAGGNLDATARSGETYVYTAQRIRHAVLNGHTLEIRSTVSPGATVVMRDSFPPRTPAELDASAAGTAGISAIDLSWRPNTEPDLAGYIVYRQEAGSNGAPLRLTSTPIPEPGFRDSTVAAGHTYSYAVTAIDSSGNESRPSTSAREKAPLP